ncbi:hypothetical protein [Methylobacterium haplocladii]|uniref:Uncharacterized protein n=1 Tax=Methylobacterium haplocladii TaxID=1176176 RepID=A0A512IN95_9HYPH|nr:hypothetical protein [Methylobacterium haplocladii]GEO99169.1 hypothetical protein MHA02_15570 [Methylobacterium haplocladii]GJD83187.1 hypothetical protein HPGCJGGD_1052 [Methylobacterium haplocladii]GLS58507.1 hypothetical protein GCM10007887_11700 [Methylobacterium haplocladii]
MKARKALRLGPVVVTGNRARGRRVRSPHGEVLGAEALDSPMPGSLLVLLSRLARSERKVSTDDDDTR